MRKKCVKGKAGRAGTADFRRKNATRVPAETRLLRASAGALAFACAGAYRAQIMRKIFAVLSSFALVCALASPIFAAADLQTVIARARAAVGPESALKDVNSLTFEAEVFDPDGKKISEIVLQFKRPYFERDFVRRTAAVPQDSFYYPEEGVPEPEPKTVEIEIETRSDGNEGVRIIRNLTDGTRRVEFLPANDVISRRDFASANLDFYGKPAGGNVELKGTEKDGGKELNVLEYTYAGGLKIERAFDAGTGALVRTKTATDTTYESGEEMLVGALKFLNGSRTVTADGSVRSTFKFSKILVNDEIPDDTFRITIEELISGK